MEDTANITENNNAQIEQQQQGVEESREVLTRTTCIIYEPSSRRELIEKAGDDTMKIQEVHKTFKEMNWLTEGLQREIVSLRPKPNDVERSSGRRSSEAFKKACKTIFPIGRIFAFLFQLQQAARMFLDQWAISSICTGKQIRCYYSKPPNRRDRIPTGVRSSKGNKNCDCPFVIRFQVKDNRKYENKPPSFYMVRISSANYEHSCTLDTIFHQTAMQSAGRLNVDITKMQTLLLLLEDNP